MKTHLAEPLATLDMCGTWPSTALHLVRCQSQKSTPQWTWEQKKEKDKEKEKSKDV